MAVPKLFSANKVFTSTLTTPVKRAKIVVTKIESKIPARHLRITKNIVTTIPTSATNTPGLLKVTSSGTIDEFAVIVPWLFT